MRVSVRSYLMAGISVAAAGTIAIPTSVAPPAPEPQRENVALTSSTAPTLPTAPRSFVTFVPKDAGVQPVVLTLTTPRQAAQQTAKADTVEPAAQAIEPSDQLAATAEVGALAFPGLSNAIINTYDTVIPWVDWGVDTAAYAVGWIPFVGLLAPQIDIFYYDLIRPIITSTVFNTAAWVGGSINFFEGVNNIVVDSVNAGRGFVNAEIDWALSWLPPLPPLPPLPFSATVEEPPAEVSIAAKTQALDAEPEPTPADSADVTEPADTDNAPEPEVTEPDTEVTEPETGGTEPESDEDEAAQEPAADDELPAPDAEDGEDGEDDAPEPDTEPVDPTDPDAEPDTDDTDDTETDTPESKTPDTEAPDTVAPGSKTPDTKTPDTKTPDRTEPKPAAKTGTEGAGAKNSESTD